jgi:predicted site-specific integrase-resolvase
MSRTRAALYARVSTIDQTCENQLTELRAYAAARGWTAREFVDAGVSGAKESGPALDDLLGQRVVARSTRWWPGGWTDSGGTCGT